MYAMTELSRINRINPDDLSLMNTTDLSDYLKVRTNIAHPQILKDGSWINMGLHIDKDRKGKHYFTDSALIHHRAYELRIET